MTFLESLSSVLDSYLEVENLMIGPSPSERDLILKENFKIKISNDNNSLYYNCIFIKPITKMYSLIEIEGKGYCEVKLKE